MPTKRIRRSQPSRTQLTPALAHLLARGCDGADADGEGLDLFLLCGCIIRGDVARLSDLWAQHGAEVRASVAGEPFADAALRAGGWPEGYGKCAEHSEAVCGRSKS